MIYRVHLEVHLSLLYRLIISYFQDRGDIANFSLSL